MTDAKKRQLMGQFKKLDKDQNGTLDFVELKTLLLKGHPGFKDDEVRKLYEACDKNGDGVIEFNEFLDYIYGGEDEDKSKHQTNRSTDGRHGRLAAAAGVGPDGTEPSDWGPLEKVFVQYGGKNKEMENKEWAKLCKDIKLNTHGMTNPDVDMIWTKVCSKLPKGTRKIGFEQFKELLQHVAQKRSMTNGEVVNMVANSAAGGPVMHATKADYVKFADDKSTFTGAHAHNDNFEGTNADAQVDRHTANQAKAQEALHAGDAEEDPWGPCEELFNSFAGAERELDGREFLKLCNDSGLVGGGFTKQDVDVTFTAVARKAKKIDFELFKDAVRQIAQKKKKGVSVVQGKIAGSSGPQLTGTTKTEAVKFYDDKSQYTGAAAGVFGREGHDDGRHEKLAEAQKLREGGDENEHDWAECLVTYEMYAGDGDGEVDSREFNKMCVDCELFDKKFTAQMVDTVFVQAKGAKDIRKLDRDKFKIAVRLIANAKGVEVYKVQNVIAVSEGPKLKATEAQYSKFHDDKSTYTGAHAE